MRKAVFIALLLLLIGLGGLWYWWVQNQAAKHLAETAKRVADVDLQADLDVDLSLKGITLSQGEKGEMHWQLTAKEANYVQEEGMVEVTDPIISYRIGKNEEMLTVEAPKGAIRQQEQWARLWPKVHATYEQNVLSAAELIYDGESRTISLTGGVTLAGPQFVCKASQLRYQLQQDMIVVEKGVEATVYVDADFLPEQGESVK